MDAVEQAERRGGRELRKKELGSCTHRTSKHSPLFRLTLAWQVILQKHAWKCFTKPYLNGKQDIRVGIVRSKSESGEGILT